MSVVVRLRNEATQFIVDVRRAATASRKALAVFVVGIVVLAAVLTGITVVALGGGGGVYVVGFDEDRLMGFERDLVNMGPRWSGTANEAQAAEYVAEQFRQAGLQDVKIEDFSHVLWEPNSASIALVPYNPLGFAPSVRENSISFEHRVDFVVQGYSGSLSSPNFRWDLLPFWATGDGSNQSHFSGGAGRVCIVEWKEASIASNTAIFTSADAAGCAAILAHNLYHAENLNYIPISKGAAIPDSWPNATYPDIPFAAMSKAMGESIRQHSGWKLRINFDVTIESRIIHVVTGDVKGTQDPSRFVMVGAHHDNAYVNRGAVDDATGTATVIELAHQLGRTSPKYTIRLATFGGEEQGLLGSRDWRDAHLEEVNNSMIAMLQFDMNHVDLERCNNVQFYTNNNDTLAGLRRSHDRIVEENPSYRTLFEPTVAWADTSRMGSDMAPFAQVGKTAMFAFGCGSWEYHTYLDDIDRITPEGMAYTGQVFASYALSLANG